MSGSDVVLCAAVRTAIGTYGGTLKEAALDGQVIRSKKLEDIAVKVVPGKR